MQTLNVQQLAKRSFFIILYTYRELQSKYDLILQVTIICFKILFEPFIQLVNFFFQRQTIFGVSGQITHLKIKL